MDTLATALFDIVTILAIIGVAAPPAPEPAPRRDHAHDPLRGRAQPVAVPQWSRDDGSRAAGSEVQQRQAVPTRPGSRTVPGSTDGGVRNDEAENGEAHD